MKKILFYISVAWILIIMGIILIPRMYDTKDVKISSSIQTDEEGPLVGELSRPETIREVITNFIEAINNNDLEFASYFIEPNYMLDIIDSGGGSPEESIQNFVRLFEPTKLKSFDLKLPQQMRNRFDCTINIYLIEGSNKKYKFTIVEGYDEHSVSKQYYIEDINLIA